MKANESCTNLSVDILRKFVRNGRKLFSIIQSLVLKAVHIYIY